MALELTVVVVPNTCVINHFIDLKQYDENNIGGLKWLWTGEPYLDFDSSASFRTIVAIILLKKIVCALWHVYSHSWNGGATFSFISWVESINRFKMAEMSEYSSFVAVKLDQRMQIYKSIYLLVAQAPDNRKQVERPCHCTILWHTVFCQDVITFKDC